MTPQWHLNRNRSPKRQDLSSNVVLRSKVIFGSKKGVINWTKITIGILLFTLCAVVLGGAYVAMSTTYDVSVEDKYTALNSKFTQVTNKTTSIGEQYQGGKLTDTNTLVLAGSSVYSGFQVMLSSMQIPIEIVSTLTRDLPFIPRVFISLILALIAIAFIYIVGAGFARWFS